MSKSELLSDLLNNFEKKLNRKLELEEIEVLQMAIERLDVEKGCPQLH
ncbi:hypothetical protein [Halalkalibacter alkalisediminis]|uniref:Uncharacterized protein n=1 Tax=Halalkalibacter alkalisediminis TaxID=935616 RepID=A0ABV6NEP1_9BACI|nr:hypothetical protein [Halalkalibacter alkalisediminis]